MNPRTKTQLRILEAVERGYTVTDDGKLLSKNKELKYSLSSKQRYPTFSTNWGGRVFGIPIHLFAAYIFYGNLAFEKGVVVRHLNGNTLDFSKGNLVLGTHSENNLDKPKHIRIAAAKKARASQGVTPVNAKLTIEQVKEIREIYLHRKGKKFPNGFVKSLCDKYSVSRTVISKIVRGKHYASYID